MKAEEIKAKELVEMFKQYSQSTNCEDNVFFTDNDLHLKNAIQCAIKCVNEIIKFHNNEFWQEVLTILKEM